ncbi:hypothetical protein CLOM_g16695 [Closterium sp. NIES-68]|nr:hypothetical protein CLOM_g16695 [Closterium sp. NIES-68]GJP82815.1 hypothetical protein CLOP_g13044 [Closterium sp. NIES-67]
MFRSLGRLANRTGAVQSAIRSFAAEAAPADVKVPTSVFGVAGKYASALYVSAVRGQQVEAVEREMRELVTVTGSNPTFAAFLRDPSVSKEVRVKAIEEIFKQAQYSPITTNFLTLLADSGRLSFLPKIAATYEDILMAHRGQVKATVTAALELTPAELAEVREALAGMLSAGQTLQLQQRVDRSIIGGVLVDIGDKHIDLSIRSKIRRMEKVLTESL